MSRNFETEYNRLNKQQKEAVNTITGPLLVLAGPGTGKTQLLGMRVANILKITDAAPDNILCLTFTESGALNMRERLRSLIGDTAYEVTISTYHSFGSEIIKNNAEHFQQISTDRTEDTRMERPVDELTQIQILEKIIEKLPFDSPLLGARYYVKTVLGTISDLKQNLISPEKLKKIANSNIKQIEKAQPLIDKVVNQKGGVSRKKAERSQQFENLYKGLSELEGDLIEEATTSLGSAMQEAEVTNSSKPLTKWKNEWLYRDLNDDFTLTDISRSAKMLVLADIYADYEQQLKQKFAYDYDDMILRAIEGLKNNDELRFNLQERYQYILLDEFQDTNPSQFELIKQLSNHPVHEGQPNVMAVGDDDQAIFAFQGANVGNMTDIIKAYKKVKVINLVDNYRSHNDILQIAQNISEQIDERLHNKFDGVAKFLNAKSDKIPKQSSISRHEFTAEASEYAWVAEKIHEQVEQGCSPSEIAVLAPKHAVLEKLVPFLKQKQIPVAYEKRENILETEIIQGLLLVAKLIGALGEKDFYLANEYFPQVLSLDYWNIPSVEIWKVNWQFGSRTEKRTWAEIALDNKQLAFAVNFYLTISNHAKSEPLESMIDKIIGSELVKDGNKEIVSPMKDYYFDKKNRATNAFEYYEALSHLSVIRSKLRDYQVSSDRQLRLSDFIDFVDMYDAADASLINSHPIVQSDKSVQLMTAYKAKGMEFENVFILQAHDDVWGSASTGGNNQLALPKNLQYIRYANSTNDERIRLLFVAITRAKHGLFITSHTTKDNGKKTMPVKYLNESEGTSPYLGKKSGKIIKQEETVDNLAVNIETLWQAGSVRLPANFKNLLSDKVNNYRMSPTHLNTFLDTEYGGPESFLVQTLLRFPQAPTASGEYGTAIHNTLEWYQLQLNESTHPDERALIDRYKKELKNRYLSSSDAKHAESKGTDALKKYLAARSDMFNIPAQAEVNFYSEGVAINGVQLSGKIDRLEIDKEAKTVGIVDYKTGEPLTKWGSSTKAHKYMQQLYFYKLLLENSTSWRGYKVKDARLEFVEPERNSRANIIEPLYVKFESAEEDKLKGLIQAVAQKIRSVDMPDISDYSNNLKGMLAFEQDLIDKKI